MHPACLQEDKALDAYAGAVSLSPHYMEAWCNQAVIHRQRGNLKEALAAYERAAMGAPNHPCVLKGLADCCAQKASLLNSQGRRAEALKLFDAALMRDSTNAGGRLCTASGFSAGQMHRLHVTPTPGLTPAPTLQSCLPDTRWAGVCSLRAMCADVWVWDPGHAPHVTSGQSVHLQHASTAEPPLSPALHHADILYHLGVALAEGRQRDRAIFTYRLAVHFRPAFAEAWNNLGVLLRDAGQMEAALEAYKGALQSRPNFPPALSNMAVMLLAQGRAREALHMLQVWVLGGCLRPTSTKHCTSSCLDEGHPFFQQGCWQSGMLLRTGLPFSPAWSTL